MIVGKGLAYGDSEKEIRKFIAKSNLPFLPTPMGKGVVSDLDPRNVASARTFALKNADCILLCGARLNWILHFGAPPRFKQGVKIIQIESDPLEFNNNVESEVCLYGDSKAILNQLTEELGSEPIIAKQNDWIRGLNASIEKN